MSDADLNEPGLERALADLKSVLIPEETLEAWAVQRRIFALARRRLLLAATSGRLVWLNRRLLGGFDVANVRWQDLEQVSLEVGVFSATLVVAAGQGSDLALQENAVSRRLRFDGLRTTQAQALYRICQAQDQAWREKRRIRELEELRARSGGVQLGGFGAGAAPAAGTGATAATMPEAMRRLQEARQMLEARLITDAEYESVKARVLSGG